MKHHFGSPELEFHRLPKRAIHRVQSFLSSKEAAQTTILSKSWRNAWLTRPNLDFDHLDFHQGYKDFTSFVNKTLKRYELSNKRIQSFRLSMKVRYALHGNATSFILRALKIGATSLSVQTISSSWYVLPDEVFGSESLVALTTKGCDINPNQVIRCSRLESLSLDSSRVDDSYIISRILSSCPLIRSLSLSHISLKPDYYYYSDSYSDYDSGYDGYDDDDDDDNDDDYDNDYYDGRIHPHGLRSMVLKNVYFDTLFLTDLSSRFPSLKDLTIYMSMSEKGQEDILISSPTLERIHFIFQKKHWSRFSSKPSCVRFDVPSIRKFTYEGSAIPLMSFRSTSRGGWESHVSIRHSLKCLSTSWFLKLRKFLNKLRRSRILSLALYVRSRRSFDYEVESIQGLRPPCEIENLTVDFEGLPSLSCYALLDALFRICHPKMITQHGIGSGNNIDFLGQTLLQGLNVRISTPSQFMYALNNLKEARAQIFDEVLSLWRDVALDVLLNGSTTSAKPLSTWRDVLLYASTTSAEDNRKVRFQLNWQSLLLDNIDYTPKYKVYNSNQRRPKVDDFEIGDYVSVVLKKKRSGRKISELAAARRIGPVKIVEKMYTNAYRLQIPSHVGMSDVFNVEHLEPYTGDYLSSDEDEAYATVNFLDTLGNDVERLARQFIEKQAHTRSTRNDFWTGPNLRN